MQLGTFIIELAERAGFAKDDAKLKDLLSVSAQVPDEIATKISESLFNMEAAKNNSHLRGYFHSQALSVPDKAIDEVLEEMKFDDAIKNEFKNEKSTPAKVKKLAQQIEAKNKALIAELEKNSGSKDSKERIEKLSEEIKKLNADLLSKDNEWNAKLKEKEQETSERIQNYAVRSILASKKYADEKKPHDVNVELANFLLQRELQAKKAKIVRNQDDTLKLVQLENPDLEYMENHKPVSFGDFADRTLANNNMLLVSNPNPGKTDAPPITPAKGETVYPSSLVNSYDDQLKKLQPTNGIHQ